MDTETQNGNGKTRWQVPSLPTFGCKGCESRKAIMGSGNWQVDAAIFALILIAIAVMWKVKVA